MSNVTLEIGGRNFVVACAQGEEDHVTSLGRIIDSKLAAMEGASGQSESRMLLFSALLLADELFELRQIASAPVAPLPPATPDGLAERLDGIAARIENLAARLEGHAANA